jgi:ABC-type transporter MlaC component
MASRASADHSRRPARRLSGRSSAAVRLLSALLITGCGYQPAEAPSETRSSSECNIQRRLPASTPAPEHAASHEARAELPSAPSAAVLAAAESLTTAVSLARSIKADDEDRLRAATEPLLAHLDLPNIARLLLGRHWTTAGSAQRERQQRALVDYFRTEYSASLGRMPDWRLDVSPAPRPGTASGYAQVPAVIRLPGRPGIPVQLHLRCRDGAWRLYNASLFGVGVVESWRSGLEQTWLLD